MPILNPFIPPRGTAPMTGGYVAGGDRFAVDGNFTVCDPCSMPEVSFPMKGDSILTYNDIIILAPAIPQFLIQPLGTGLNIHPWNPNQQVMILEQEFMVAQEAYEPMPLNTPYNVAWALGWIGFFPSGYPAASFYSLVLVEEGELRDVGGGISRLKRKWATVPPTRSEIEQYSAIFPGLAVSGAARPPFTRNVASRLQYDYFITDFLDVLSTPTIAGGGNRIDPSTNYFPSGLVIPEQQYFISQTLTDVGNFFVGATTDTLNDVTPSFPRASDYIGWAIGTLTSNGLPAEIVAEASTVTRWMGNIWERRTRFVTAQ